MLLNSTFKPHMPITSCADTKKLCQYICPHELTAMINVSRSTGIHAFHICPEQICLPYCTYKSHCTSTLVHRPHITAHIHQKSINCNICLPYYCKICASKKYAPQMPHVKLLNVNHLGNMPDMN